MKRNWIILIIVFCQLLAIKVTGQEQNIYSQMSLDEIMDIDVVVTASKVPEDLFETPLSVTILKQKDLLNSGATSIAEALRLAPGMIVRETTPGNFDVHIRGFDDVTRNSFIPLPMNATILVMIDNRVVYSYFTGGTLWETLPIDIVDVEQIEIVRGPASALYGPNAVTGVINIITKHARKDKLNATVNASAGINKASSVNTALGYNWNNKTSLTFSGNFAYNPRYETNYFNWKTLTYVEQDDLTVGMYLVKDSETNELWEFDEFSDTLNSIVDETLGLRKSAVNIFFNHQFNSDSKIDISTGYQNSISQRPGFFNFVSPISTFNSNSCYFDGKLKLDHVYAQISLSSGSDISNYKFSSYRYLNIESYIEYYYQYKNFSLRPGISYKKSNYNSPITYKEAFDFQKMNYQFKPMESNKEEDRVMSSIAASLLGDWQPLSRWRIIAGLRFDKFNINKNLFYNYEIGSTYRLDKYNLLRIVHSKASRSPFIFDTYLNAKMDIYSDFQFESNVETTGLKIEQYLGGAKQQKTLENNLFEISWRSKISTELKLDVEVFSQKVKNIMVSNLYRTINLENQLDEMGMLDSVVSGYGTGKMLFENFDNKSQQLGFSFTLNYQPNQKWDFNLNGTIQKTWMSGTTEIEFNQLDVDVAFDEESNIMTLTEFSTTNQVLWSEKLTPMFYGGFMVNYRPDKHWKFNLNGYFYSEQIFGGIPFYNVVADYSGVFYRDYDTIKANLNLNTKVSYQLNSNSNIYFNGRNLLGSHKEFGFSDKIGRSWRVGFEWKF